jgi:hypothetical protein
VDNRVGAKIGGCDKVTSLKGVVEGVNFGVALPVRDADSLLIVEITVR